MNKNFGISIVRIGLSLVYLWFGSSQVLHPAEWAITVPNYATKILPVSAEAFVLGNGIFEIVFGLLLLIGIYSRFVSGILALHTLHIVTIVGYNAIGVRDFGLAISMIGVFLASPDAWTLDYKRVQKTTSQPLN